MWKYWILILFNEACNICRKKVTKSLHCKRHRMKVATIDRWDSQKHRMFLLAQFNSERLDPSKGSHIVMWKKNIIIQTHWGRIAICQVSQMPALQREKGRIRKNIERSLWLSIFWKQIEPSKGFALINIESPFRSQKVCALENIWFESCREVKMGFAKL